MSTLKDKTLYLIDGSGFIFRAYYALPPLTRPDGTPIGAVLGFTNMILRLMDDMQAHHMAVVFDSKRQNFRHEIYPEYKANRSNPPEDLIPQFPIMRHACHAFNIPVLEQEGYEADDLIASYTQKATREGFKVVIISSDKDLMQLVSESVVLYDHMKNTYIHPQQVIDKFGVPPEKVLDVLALAGDSSDNVPGVPGIGPKTAADLIVEFGDFEALFNNLAKIKQPKRFQTLSDHKAQAYLSRQLVQLKKDINALRPIESLQQGPLETDELRRFLDEQGFKSIKSRLQINSSGPIEKKQPLHLEYTGIHTFDDLDHWIEKIIEKGVVAFDTETTSLDAQQTCLVGISLCIEPGKACYIPLGHTQTAGLLSKEPVPPQLPIKDIISKLKNLFENPGILKIAHNAKFDAHVLAQHDIHVTPLEDTIVLSSLLRPGGHSLDELAQAHFSYTMTSFKDLVGPKKAKNFAEVPIEEAIGYAAEDADVTLRLWHLYQEKLFEEKCYTPYYTVDRPMLPILINMEQRGIKVDSHLLKHLGEDFNKKMDALEKEVYQAVGKPFNLASPKQLGDILFEELKLPGGKKGKSGAYGTGADVLEKLAFEGHHLVQKILDWRQYAKLKSTYVDGLLKEVRPQNQRVHTNYTLFMTSTGRLSSTNPNLQNIPIRTDVGRQIRKAFIASPGYQLVSLDYSQIELRLLAHIAKIEPLQEAFQNNLDIHRLTASQVFGIPYDEISKELRRKAKAINFGIIYGISGFGLARQLDVSTSEAANYIKQYKAQYPGITHYMQETIEQARNQGYVSTLYGRHCYIPNILSKNPALKNYAERQAINAPLQGSNADIIKRAMIRIPDLIKSNKFDAFMLLQVHDELIFEVRQEQTSNFIEKVKNLMSAQAHLSVPLIVDAGAGSNWGEAH
jgi:DNA polymerase-1